MDKSTARKAVAGACFLIGAALGAQSVYVSNMYSAVLGAILASLLISIGFMFYTMDLHLERYHRRRR